MRLSIFKLALPKLALESLQRRLSSMIPLKWMHCLDSLRLAAPKLSTAADVSLMNTEIKRYIMM